MRTPLIAGNWKMNGSLALVEDFGRALAEARLPQGVEVAPLRRAHSTPPRGGVVLVSEEVEESVHEQARDLRRHGVRVGRRLRDRPLGADHDLAQVTVGPLRVTRERENVGGAVLPAVPLVELVEEVVPGEHDAHLVDRRILPPHDPPGHRPHDTCRAGEAALPIGDHHLHRQSSFSRAGASGAGPDLRGRPSVPERWSMPERGSAPALLAPADSAACAARSSSLTEASESLG